MWVEFHLLSLLGWKVLNFPHRNIIDSPTHQHKSDKLVQLGAESGLIIHLLKRYVDDVTAICETIKMGVRWKMPNSKAANVSDVFGSVVPGGPPRKPTTVGPHGNQSNRANVSSKC